MSTPAVVIDNGTGYTKMGYAGNCEPSFIIPSLLGTKEPSKCAKSWKGVEDLDYWIGDEAAQRSAEYCALWASTFPRPNDFTPSSRLHLSLLCTTFHHSPSRLKTRGVFMLRCPLRAQPSTTPSGTVS